MNTVSDRAGFSRWISLMVLVCLISACGTLHQEETLDQTEDASQPLVQTTAPDEASEPVHPTSSPVPMEPSTSSSTQTPAIETEPITGPAPIPHFPPGEPVTITYIKMMDGTSGWAIGSDEAHAVDHILTTSDGGRTWRDVTPDETFPLEMNEYTYKWVTAFFLDGQVASVIYDPEKYRDPARIWCTSSAGNQWDLSIIETNFQTVEALTFADESHGWLMLGVDAGMGHSWVELYRTRDGGKEWELIIDPYREVSADLHYCCKTGMVFFGADTGLVTFGRGPMGGAFINWTDDGGLTWESHPLPRPEGAFEGLGDAEYGILCESHSPSLFSPQSGRVALECWTDIDASDTVSFIFTTFDGGSTWESATYPGGQMLFLTPEVGWALSKDIYQTLDGGQTWTLMSTVQWEGQFSFVNQQLGWAVARSEETFALLQTEDGGKTWDVIEPVIAE
jgi:photosystem II stability/assembly factor-like uncharacterized protein